MSNHDVEIKPVLVNTQFPLQAAASACAISINKELECSKFVSGLLSSSFVFLFSLGVSAHLFSNSARSPMR